MRNAILNLFVNLRKCFTIFMFDEKRIITKAQGPFFLLKDHPFCDSLDAFFHTLRRGKGDPTFIVGLSSSTLNSLHFFEQLASVVFVCRLRASIAPRID